MKDQSTIIKQSIEAIKDRFTETQIRNGEKYIRMIERFDALTFEQIIQQEMESLATKIREETIGEVCDNTRFNTRCEQCDDNSSYVAKLLRERSNHE